MLIEGIIKNAYFSCKGTFKNEKPHGRVHYIEYYDNGQDYYT